MSGNVVKNKKALQRYEALCKKIREKTAYNPLETKEQQQARIKRGKKDFKYFVETYFKHYSKAATPDFHVNISRKVQRNKKYKGWLKWARGHAKSVVAIVLLPLWLWINDDIKFVLVIGATEKKAAKLLGDLQAEFENNQLLIHDFGNQRTNGNWTEGDFVTKSGFCAVSLGKGQEPRGARNGADRPDYIVADDWETKKSVKNPIAQDEDADWLLASVIPTMDDGNRRVLICQNHFAPRMIFQKIVEENEAWDVDQVNGYDPVTYEPTWHQKYHRWFFLEIEKEIGTLKALAEYNHMPYVKGKVFTDELIQWTKIPTLKSMLTIVARWDVAYGGNSTSDFNAVPIWGLKDGKKYKIDSYCRQSKLADTLDWIAFRQQYYHAKGVIIQFGFEAQFWNDEIYRCIAEAEAKHKIVLNLIKVTRSTDNKADRIMTMLPQYQNNRVFYGVHLKSSNDNQVALGQLKGIEPGYKGKDDGPDADHMCFEELDKYESAATTHHVAGPKRESKDY